MLKKLEARDKRRGRGGDADVDWLITQQAEALQILAGASCLPIACCFAAFVTAELHQDDLLDHISDSCLHHGHFPCFILVTSLSFVAAKPTLHSPSCKEHSNNTAFFDGSRSQSELGSSQYMKRQFRGSVALIR